MGRKLSGYLILIITTLTFTSYVVEKTIFIQPDKKTNELTFYLNPSVKRGGIGLYIISPLGIQVEIPELIKSLKVFNIDNELLWEVVYKNLEFGGNGIKYGNLNTKEYIQKYPEIAEPNKLIRGEIYYVILKTEKAEYKRKFFFQEAKIKSTKNDLIKN